MSEWVLVGGKKVKEGSLIINKKRNVTYKFFS